MMRFKVQGMTHEDYHAMMSGLHLFYHVEEFWIKAETKEEAYNIACNMYPELIINKFVESEEEFEARIKREAEIREEEKRKEQEKAERKAKREQEKAKTMGLTIEEYNEYKRLERNKKRYEGEIRKHYVEIEDAKKGIEYAKKKITEYENKMKEVLKNT